MGDDSVAISRESLTGQVSLLLWFNDHHSSWTAMEMFNHIYTLYQDNPRVRMLGVWAEGNNMSDKNLAHLLNERNIGVPIVRDIHAVGKSVFAILAAPTLIILDPRSRLQIFEVEMDFLLTRQLPTVIDRLVNGIDLATEILQKYERELLEYQQHLSKVNDRLTFEVPRIEIGDRTNPQYLNLSQLWRNTSIKMPGNVYSWDQQGDPAIFVCDGVSTIVELDRTGNVTARHVLDIPQNSTVSWL